MSRFRSRRQFISGVASLPVISMCGQVGAQSVNAGDNLLARLRKANKVTVGVTNNPPYSSLLPDGSLEGLTPTLTKLIMGRLGVSNITGVVASYGELIPGLQAGRWDFIAASLTISKARCSQVTYSDPIVFDGGSFVSIKGALADPPKTLKDLVARQLTIGVSAGGAIYRLSLEAGLSPDNVKQFPDDVAIVDALVENASIWVSRPTRALVSFTSSVISPSM